MPPAQVCVKCKTSSAAEGDSWCNGCSAWEFIGRELTASWDSQGSKLLANDIAVSAARQIRAVRSLAAGLVRQGETAAGESPAVVGSSTSARAGGGERESLPRRRSSAPPPPVPKEEELSEEEEDEETDEDSDDETRGQSVKDNRKPPEPEGSPPGYSKRGRDRESAGKHRASSYPEGRHREGKRRRSSGHRGGRKHQRLHRLAENPNLVIHRKPGPGFWDLASSERRGFDQTHLGR